MRGDADRRDVPLSRVVDRRCWSRKLCGSTCNGRDEPPAEDIEIEGETADAPTEPEVEELPLWKEHAVLNEADRVLVELRTAAGCVVTVEAERLVVTGIVPRPWMRPRDRRSHRDELVDQVTSPDPEREARRETLQAWLTSTTGRYPQGRAPTWKRHASSQPRSSCSPNCRATGCTIRVEE